MNFTRIFFALVLSITTGVTVAKEKPPVEQPGAVRMLTSWYCSQGKLMANRQPMRCQWMTAASNTLALGTLLFLENPLTSESTYAVVTDRGPFIYPRELDVSLAAAHKLGFDLQGTAVLIVRVVSTPGCPLDTPSPAAAKSKTL